MKKTIKNDFSSIIEKKLEIEKKEKKENQKEKEKEKEKNNQKEKKKKTINEKEIEKIQNEFGINSKLGKISLFENENQNEYGYLYNEKGILNNEIKKKLKLYNEKKENFKKILKGNNEKEKEKIKKDIEKIENEKGFNIISQYIKINNIGYNEKDIIKGIEIENIKKDYILKICNDKRKNKKIKNYNIENIKKYINQKIKKSKDILFENEIENENIFGKNQNFDIGFFDKINNNFILEKIEKKENEIFGNTKKNNFQYIVKINNEKEKNKNGYKKQSIEIKDKINNDYNFIMNSSNRIYDKYLKKYGIDTIENEKEIEIKEKILNLYNDKINNIKENKIILENLYNNYHGNNNNINNKLKRKRNYFQKNYGLYYIDYLYNNLKNKYKKGYVFEL